MKRVLIFGGTTEGRKIAETLSSFSGNKILTDISVATEYGEQVLPVKKNLNVLTGRLDEKQIEKLCEENKYDLLIDATHPYARIVSENVKTCGKNLSIPVIRFERKIFSQENENIMYVSSSQEAFELLEKTSGNILLTTGSKDLNIFCQNEAVRKRIFARVLPCMESLKLCNENGLEGKQIIAMQGPFSKAMNIAQIKEYDISVLVTKESGKTGGTDSKLEAAAEQNINCIVIKNNSSEVFRSEDEKYFSVQETEELFKKIEIILGIKIEASEKLKVYLAGIGMGNVENLTVRVQKLLAEADYIFGAKRMLESVPLSARKIPFYLPENILPELQKITEQNNSRSVVVLFSGDTGFFSGSSKLYNALKENPDLQVEILPGISSMSYLASKLYISYQDAQIISLHGTKKEKWFPELNSSLEKNKKIFLLTSGIDDIRAVAEIIIEKNKQLNSEKYFLGVGYQLSYEDEQISVLLPEECDRLNKDGLYSIFLFQQNGSIIKK